MTAEQTRKAALAKSLEAQARVKRENAKHTPGPWNSERAESSECFDVKCECGFFVATCHDGVRSESNAEANARLIAAAPELLEAAQAAWNCIAELSPTQARVEVALMLQEAVEKATGDTP
jgi:hypothetical protein